jgi:hypothetical protein
MKTRRYFSGTTVPLVAIVLATLFLGACQQAQQQAAPTPVAVSQLASAERMFVIFEGPWAFSPDPKDAASIVAIAPKTKGHRELYVKASNQSILTPGLYDLSFPAHSGSAAGTADPAIIQAKIDAKSLQHVIDSKSGRYVIRLPKPEEYRVAARGRSRLGAKYPPDASSEDDHAVAVSLRYNVNSLNGFSLSGTPDSATFNTLLLEVETPAVRFVIEPAMDDDPKDKCDTHSRESFHDLTALLGLTLYVDFPDYSDDCHKSDPQTPHPARAETGRSSLLEHLARLVPESPRIFTRVEGARMPGYLAATMFFFSKPGGDCHGPNIILTPTP